MVHDEVAKLGNADLMDLKDTAHLASISGLALDRPQWDDWFMTLCFVIAQRSIDPATKHGCVVVDDARTILSVGYNSPPRGCDDANVPLERPAKYHFIQHSETNCIVNAARSGICLRGSIFYITGPPCNDCFAKIINVGASKIVHGPILHQRTDQQIWATEFMKKGQSIEIVEKNNVVPIFALLDKTKKYINRKLGEM